MRAHLWLIIAGAAVALGAATLFGFAWTSDQAEREATQRMTLDAARAASAIGASVETTTRATQGLAAQPGLADAFAGRGGQCQLSTEGTPAFPSIRFDLVAPDGRVACSSDPALAAAANSRDTGAHAGSRWLGAALRARKPLVDWNATDAASGRSAVVVGVGVPGTRTPAGAVVALLHLPEAAASLAKNFAGIHAASFTVVDRASGKVMSDSQLPPARLGGARFDHSARTGEWVGTDGARRLFGSAEVKGSDWLVYSGVRAELVFADARGALIRQALVGIIALLILGLAAWVLNRRVAGPLRTVTGAAVAAAHDPDGPRVREAGTAEVAALARAFNGLLDIRAGHEAQLTYQATHDPLTGLPNRVLAREQLAEALQGDDPGTVVVLWIGVDRLDVINDSFGHDVGDRVLVKVAERLSAALRPEETLTRFGGDEFIVVCENLSARDSDAVAERLHQCFAQPFAGPQGDIVLRASVGIAEAHRSRANPDHLLAQADSAMREARATGNNFCRFDRALRDRATRHLEVEHALWQALQRDEFLVHYQPLLELRSRRIVGAEALVRWQHPKRGLVPPLEFIPIAEQTGQIIAIGEVVLAKACGQAAAWHAAGHPLRLSVNVAVDQLRDETFPGLVARILTETGLPADMLCLEITESSVIGETGIAATGIAALRGLGVQLAIDDFGTGYSSLSYLHNIPVDELKIDRSFISRLDHVRDRHLVEAIIRMANALDLSVVAEGVETEGQRHRLTTLGCRLAQGYLFAAPQTADAFVALLDAQRRELSLVAA